MKIQSAVFQISSPNLQSCPASERPEFAFIGRSNVGKSSLLNLLTGSKTLAKVSSTPGHTQLINFFTINNAWTLVDLPGYGYARTLKEGQHPFEVMISEFLSGRANLARVFVLIDSRHSPQTIDLEFVHWISGCEVPFSLVFTKTDKTKPMQLKTNIELFQTQLTEWSISQPEVFLTSSENRTGRFELLDSIEADLKPR